MKKSTSCPTLQFLDQPSLVKTTQIVPRLGYEKPIFESLICTRRAHIQANALSIQPYSHTLYPLYSEPVPYYFNAAYNTFTCFSQSDDVKDIAACIACPPEVIEDTTHIFNAPSKPNSVTSDVYLRRFEEYYRIFKKNRKKNNSI